MKKYNENKNVYEASIERIEFIFKNFEKYMFLFQEVKILE